MVPALIVLFLCLCFIGFGMHKKFFLARGLPPPMLLQSISDRDMLHGFEKIPGDYSFCLNRAGGTGSQTLFVGDSYMQQYGSRIAKDLVSNIGNSRGAILITLGGVMPVSGVTNKNGRFSTDLMDKFQELVFSDARIDRIVIAARWSVFFDKKGGYEMDGIPLGDSLTHEQVIQKLGRNIRTLVDKHKNVTLVLDVPSSYFLDPKIMYPRTFKGTYAINKNIVTKENFLHENRGLLAEIALTARKNGAEVIDPLDYLCTNGICIAEDENGIPIRFDEGHLRPGYVRDHVKYLDHTVEP